MEEVEAEVMYCTWCVSGGTCTPLSVCVCVGFDVDGVILNRGFWLLMEMFEKQASPYVF